MAENTRSTAHKDWYAGYVKYIGSKDQNVQEELLKLTGNRETANEGKIDKNSIPTDTIGDPRETNQADSTDPSQEVERVPDNSSSTHAAKDLKSGDICQNEHTDPEAQAGGCDRETVENTTGAEKYVKYERHRDMKAQAQDAGTGNLQDPITTIQKELLLHGDSVSSEGSSEHPCR